MTFHNPNSQRGNLLDCPALPILRLHSLLIAVEYRLQQLGIRENWFCSSVVSVYRTTNKKQDTLAVSAVNTVCGFVSGYHSVPLCSSHQTLFCLLTDYLLYLGPLLIVRSSDRDTSLLQKKKTNAFQPMVINYLVQFTPCHLAFYIPLQRPEVSCSNAVVLNSKHCSESLLVSCSSRVQLLSG